MEQFIDIKNEDPELSNFIEGSDNQNRIIIVSLKKFTEKFSPLNELEQVSILIKFHRLLRVGKISPENKIQDWNGIDFEKFIESELTVIEKKIVLEDKIEIYRTIDEIYNSESSIYEKIKKLVVYKDAFCGPWIDGNDFSQKDIVNYIKSKLEVLEVFFRQEQYQSPQKTTSTKRYKPNAKFAEYLMVKNPLGFISKLKEIFPTGRNKEAAIMITALIENEKISMPTVVIDIILAIQDEWKTEFDPENFYKPHRQISRSKKTGYKGEVLSAINKVRQISCL